MISGIPSCTTCSSVPHDTLASVTVVVIWPRRLGSSNLSVYRNRWLATSSRYSPPKLWLWPVEKFVNHIL